VGEGGVPSHGHGRRRSAAVCLSAALVLLTSSAFTVLSSNPAVAAVGARPENCRIVAQPTYSDFSVCKDVDWHDPNLDHADLSKAVFDRTKMTGGSAISADFPFAYLSDATLTDMNLSSTSLVDTGVEGATFNHDNFSSAGVGLFYPAIRKEATFNNDDFTSAHLFGSFKHVTLRNPNFTDADLRNADFSGASLTGAIWHHTTCPDGTNSDQAGGTCAGHLLLGDWVWIDMHLRPHSSFTSTCNQEFGKPGTQTCGGSWDGRTEPDNVIPGWAYANGENDGTTFATPLANGEFQFALDAPGAEIDGYSSGEASDRFYIQHSDLHGVMDSVLTPPGAVAEPVGSQGGPLALNVAGSCTIFNVCKYDITLTGWVILRK